MIKIILILLLWSVGIAILGRELGILYGKIKRKIRKL